MDRMPRPKRPLTLSHKISDETVEQVRQDYESGMSVWAVQNKWAASLLKTEVRLCLEGMIRPKGELATDPSEEEVAREREQIRAKWTPEQASRRWVGRYLSSPEQAGRQFSKILTAIGGNL